MPKRTHVLRYGLLLFLVYAVIIAVYVWYTSPNKVPQVYQGTAADPAVFFSSLQLKQSETLNAVRNWIFFMSWPWDWGIYVLLLAGGVAAKWKEALERRGLPIYVRFPVFVLLVSLASFLLYFPLRLLSYSMSRAYGITTQPTIGWLRDKLVSFCISYIIMLAVSAVAFWIISRGGRWWLKLWLLSVPFTIFMMYIQPVVVDPLYNHFSELRDPRLEQKILALADKANIPANRVYEVDMSAKTNAMNAYVNGFGASLRIVLWDTTLKQLTEQEVLLVMAHEMGHYVMHHLEWSAVGAVVSSFFVIWIGSTVFLRVVRKKGWSWGIHKPSDMTALPLFLLLISVMTFVSLPFSNYVSRQAETSADWFAMRLIGSAEGAVSMNQKMALSYLDQVNPPLLVKWFRADHPSDMERIIDAERFEQSPK